jgi:integrase
VSHKGSATGLRCGEVYQLRRQDVFLDKGYLKVVKGKTKSSVRKVHLTDKAAQILSARMQQFEGENLFPHRNFDGEKATGSLSRRHLETIKKLGYKFRLYDCRHTFATRAVESGVDLVVLASILGHANLKMVMCYAHPSEKHKVDAMQQIEKAKSVKR